MKFKFPDRAAALEFANYLASPEEFAMNGIVDGDVVDVPGIEPDRCSPRSLNQLETAAGTLDGTRPSADDRFSLLVDSVQRLWRRRRYHRRR